MSICHDPELSAAFDALLEEFPRHGNRISADEMSKLVTVRGANLELLDWVTLRADHAGRFYAPAGELLAKIKERNPNLGALAYPKGRWT